ncbi:hypothetical protein ACWEQP_14710 [Streptomyces sp. NPDC004044]
MCSVCGHRDGPKPLHIRTWTCTACGVRHGSARTGYG